ncbi:DUF2637 domain-containing protein [Plantactinospora sp. KLBMP9567]|uniref:DUF2637 domain-containing protein n=1 Tax=Plantactinospora sp. KLBMP9567 TaxID=3085900 RepID=UPI002981C549|nr:DUF2637 domain-containing protein [Plantactinospora sp. KLBMP9567]MDW5323769.1 DUF2637 domain-containing protein [Plantactinospora sp. KLBMP9567]MDW5326889.1 DUF2637 domain-containing protein [Plantactinospora sp. KLBMP9567]
MPLPQLRRVRWAVRATLALGVAASVVANILHARDNPISQAIAAWPPLALLLTVELISRVPVHRRSLAFARMAATATIAGIAAWVSYWHMVGVAARYGETGASPYLLPLSVDGLIVVASICLVELGGRISAAQAATSAEATRSGPAAESAEAGAFTRTGEFDRVILGTERAAGPGGDAGTRRRPAASNGGPLGAVEPLGRGIGEILAIPSGDTETGVSGGTQAGAPGTTGAAAPPDAGTAARTRKAPTGAARKRGSTGRAAGPGAAARPRRPITETAALAAAIQAERPEASDADVAQELGITTARLRAIRREVRELDLVA